MYVPEAISKVTNGPGSILAVGVALISAIVAGIALGWVGTVAVVVAIFLLLVVEVVREAAGATRRRDELEHDLATAHRDASVIPTLRSERKELQGALTALEEENRRPRLRPEEILDVIGIHVHLIDVVQRHRQIESQVPDIPVTRAELTEQGILLTGTCIGEGDIVRGEPLTVVETQSGTAWGDSAETSADGTQVQASFQSDTLPPNLADEVARQGSLNPSGYVLRLSGLHVPNYDSQTDEELQAVRDALQRASSALANTLSIRPFEIAGADDLAEDNQTFPGEEEEEHS